MERVQLLDKELKDILTKLIRDQDKITSEIIGLKDEINSLSSKVNNLPEGQNSLKVEINRLNDGVGNLSGGTK